MRSQELTVVGNGVLGASIAQGTLLASINDLGVGRWKVWGSVRHSQPDSILLRLIATTLISKIPSVPTKVAYFGPIVIDVLGKTDDFILELAVATGVGESASGVIYAQRISPI